MIKKGTIAQYVSDSGVCQPFYVVALEEFSPYSEPLTPRLGLFLSESEPIFQGNFNTYRWAKHEKQFDELPEWAQAQYYEALLGG
jgi:hypothetical protein